MYIILVSKFLLLANYAKWFQISSFFSLPSREKLATRKLRNPLPWIAKGWKSFRKGGGGGGVVWQNEQKTSYPF